MNGLIITNTYAPSPSRQAARIAAELAKSGAGVSVLRSGELGAALKDGRTEISSADFCVFLDKDKYTARMLEQAGVRLFDSAAAIELCDDKALTHITLADRGIPMPDTIPAPLCYTADVPYDRQTLDRAERELGYPVVIKQSFGSLGKGVFKADDRADLERIAAQVQTSPHLFQRYIKSSAGRDLRVIVVGGQPLGAMLRTSTADFRSNIGLGGRAERAELSAEAAEICVVAANALGLDYCGIDLLFGEHGMLLCEVNSNAFFDAFEGVTGINVAAAYASHIIASLR